MTIKKEIKNFVNAQQSLQSYPKTRRVFKSVLSKMPAQEFKKLTKNLVVVALHEGVFGQVMHFPHARNGIRIMQLTLRNDIPSSVLRFVIAHELGHVAQGRNWKKSDGKILEIDADRSAKNWGFPRTKSIDMYIEKHWKEPKG